VQSPPKYQYFHLRTRKNNPKICVEAQKTPVNQSNPEQEEQCRKHHNTAFQNVLQTHNDKSSMVLV
jgi:hypothetical protein